MRNLGRLVDWATSTHGVVMLMTLIMAAMTLISVLDYHTNDLPGKWWLVAFSSTAAGSGAWALKAGSTPTIRYWCGIFWMVYGVARSLSWLSLGSLSGFISWLPCALLGLVVFARRNSALYVRERDECAP